MSKNAISVVMRSKNEERWIGHAIQSVIEKLDNPEIIIVDNHSTDTTKKIAQSFKADPDIENYGNYAELQIIEISDYSPGKALNLGVQKATYDYILIMSSHCVLTQFNLEEHLNDLNDHHALFGNQIPVWEGKKITKRYIWSHFSNKSTTNMYSDLEKRYFLHNALAIYRKSILKKFPFDENLTSKEDRYWANKIIKKKMNFTYDPELIAEHQYTIHGNTWKGIA